MENFGYLGPPAFTAGRRRKFDEFALGEEVQADRIHRPLHAQIPRPLEGPWNRSAVPYESLIHIDRHFQVGPPPQNSQRSLTRSHVLAQGFAVGSAVIAVMSMQLFRTVLRETSRAGPYVYVNRDHSAADISDGNESDESYFTAPETHIHESFLTVDGTDKFRASSIPKTGSSASTSAKSRTHNAQAQASSEHGSNLPGPVSSGRLKSSRREARERKCHEVLEMQSSTPRRRSGCMAEKLKETSWS
ncbi:hypothetical protein MMC29_001065 [Sticta canariensis]|nr:hypothetical protein [Sticta canariensis]